MSLSDKILECGCGLHNCGETYMPTKDVKEFIRELKKDVLKNNYSMKKRLEILNKLAGEKLIE